MEPIAWQVIRGGMAQTLLEEIMATQAHKYHSEFTEKYRTEGRTEGQTEGRVREARRMFFTVVDGLGLTLSPADRERAESCQDPRQFERWVTKALKASSASELFSE